MDHDYIGTIQRLEGLTDFKCSVVEYVGGFVVKQVERNLKCAMCRSSLTSGPGSESLTLKLVNTKDKGGLTRLSPHVKTVCEVAEKCLLHVKKTKRIPSACPRLIEALCTTVFKVVTEKYSNCFEELNEHDMDCTIMQNHKHIVIKSIVMCYLKIRLHHEAKTHSEKIQVHIKLQIVLHATYKHSSKHH